MDYTYLVWIQNDIEKWFIFLSLLLLHCKYSLVFLAFYGNVRCGMAIKIVYNQLFYLLQSHFGVFFHWCGTKRANGIDDIHRCVVQYREMLGVTGVNPSVIMVDSKEKIGRGEKQRSRGIERVEEKNSDKKKEEKEGE